MRRSAGCEESLLSILNLSIRPCWLWLWLSLPGCVSQGATRSEAQANIREAIELYLKSLRTHREPIPPGTEEEVIQVTG
jgi:predicted RNase H-like HicB family nuclease